MQGTSAGWKELLMQVDGFRTWAVTSSAGELTHPAKCVVQSP